MVTAGASIGRNLERCEPGSHVFHWARHSANLGVCNNLEAVRRRRVIIVTLPIIGRREGRQSLLQPGQGEDVEVAACFSKAGLIQQLPAHLAPYPASLAEEVARRIFLPELTPVFKISCLVDLLSSDSLRIIKDSPSPQVA